jgi:anti-sigma regulatory factor (Ser/Thr protein kinase)
MNVQQAQKEKDFFHVSLKPDLAVLARVRALVDDLCTDVRVPPSKAYDLKVAVSEACANAIAHSPDCGPVDVLLT